MDDQFLSDLDEAKFTLAELAREGRQTSREWILSADGQRAVRLSNIEEFSVGFDGINASLRDGGRIAILMDPDNTTSREKSDAHRAGLAEKLRLIIQSL